MVDLYCISKVLGVPVSYFYENVEDNIPDSASVPKSDNNSIFTTNEKEIAALMRAYNNIACPLSRKKIVSLMETL